MLPSGLTIEAGKGGARGIGERQRAHFAKTAMAVLPELNSPPRLGRSCAGCRWEDREVEMHDLTQPA